MTGNLRSRDLPLPSSPASAEDRRLHGASITADVILEPSHRDPRPIRGFAGPAAQIQTSPLSSEARAERNKPGFLRVPRSDGLRLMPLSGFAWGGPMRSTVPGGQERRMPRLRGDHVILFVAKGGTILEFPRKSEFVGEGRIAYIPAGTAFSLHPRPAVEGWALLLPPDLVADLPVPLPSRFQYGLPSPADETLLGPALAALGQDHLRGSVEPLATACHLSIVSLALSRASQDVAGVEAEHLHSTEGRILTDSFLSLADRHLGQNRTIAEMARDLGCTVAQLDHACHETRGRSPLELLYALRLDHAAVLLRETDLDVAQIAEDLGYSGPGHFMRSFAAATGRTPEAFRTLLQDGPAAGD
ncbi:helix-turn-helix transcriptional regulator [Paracoccus ravus]|uniref:helix-turn-helix transcriptional regulator n=1 Tax=Paracoccus ravus TaxID=2447760 RepID=UPI00106EE529|nr:AraC family transcriptional regulator [Paracoccus ravus]